jgi:predicted NAD-dependent protein-ADP-ribosyltransferase YbiA (DUF1768 family)
VPARNYGADDHSEGTMVMSNERNGKW